MKRAGLLAAVLLVLGCSEGGARPVAPVCEAACREDIAVRGVRETLKLVFNLALQGKPVGAHDETLACPLGGTARVFGTATSNAEQGSTFVTLAYELTDCAYSQQDDEPEEAYAIVTTGVFEQEGTLAVQPSSTTALRIESTAVSVRGTVYDPAVPYEASACPLRLVQNGSLLSGTLCERPVGLDL